MSKNPSAMNPMDNCWMQYHAGSLPPPGEMSQNNFFQQRQQPSCTRPNQQSQCPNFPPTQHGGYFQSQPDQFPNQVPPQQGLQQHQQIPSTSQPPQGGQLTCTLPPGLIDQIRACMPATSGPIFILPTSNPMPPQQTIQSPHPPTCPGAKYPGQYCCQPSYYPCPIPMPLMNPFVLPQQQQQQPAPPSCSCCPRKQSEDTKKQCKNELKEQCMEVVADDDEAGMCAKKNCPASINLQALASQLLSIQGVISCAATRLILRKVPGSNIVDGVEEVIERGKKAINVMNQDQLLTEIRSCQQVNALINLHMTASPPASVIPILTTVQLKINLLKSHADGLINRRLSENQGMGAEGSGQLDQFLLSLKSDEEVRTLLSVLRQKECNERVNYSFAPYESQRVIAEARLRNVENKINQVEMEMERRRSLVVPRGISGNFSWSNYFGRGNARSQGQTYESPDPFQIIHVTNPRKLNLAPEVTYREARVITFDEDFKSQDVKGKIGCEEDESKVQEESHGNLTDSETMKIKVGTTASPTNMSCDSGTLEKKLSSKDNIKEDDSSSIREF